MAIGLELTGVSESIMLHGEIYFTRDYAAALATGVKNGCRDILAQGKYHKVSVLEAESFDAMIPQVSLKKYFFSEFWVYPFLVKVNDRNLNAALERSARRTTELRRHQPIMVLI